MKDGKVIYHEKSIDPCPVAQVPPTPTLAPPRPPPAPAPAPPAIIKRLFVMYEEYMDQILAENHWDFFTRPGDNNDKWDPCKSKAVLEDKKALNGDIEKPLTPNGSWNLKLFDVGCVYNNDGKSTGTLNCPGTTNPATCVEEEAASIACQVFDFSSTYKAVVKCDW
jgi:hypothetical protein